MTRKKGASALRGLDDSMAPDLPAGAAVVVGRGEPPAHHGSVMLVEHDGEFRLRRYRLAARADGGASWR